jgi:glycosyltransferase involved in cell wall biosynthesis
MNKSQDMVTIAIHTGKEEYVPLLQNLLKSFLLSNEYTNIELMLVESGSEENVRVWLESLDFDSNFVNFDGTTTSIKKAPSVSIKKTLLFNNFDSDFPWNLCYMQSLKDAIKKASGDFFVYLAEDNQMTVSGNIISEYIHLINTFGRDRTIVHFCSQQGYKYRKENNRFGDVIKADHVSAYQPINMKWCPFSLIHKDALHRIGNIPLPDNEDPHKSINVSSQRCRDMGFSRYYPAVSVGVWLPNSNRQSFIDLIVRKTIENPDYVMIPIFKKDTVEKTAEDMKRPISTDDFLRSING